MPTPSLTRPRDGLRELHGRRQLLEQEVADALRVLERAVTVDMNGGDGFCQAAFASAGFSRSAARATSGQWKAPLTRSFTVLRAPRAARLLDQRGRPPALAGDDELAGAVVVRRPHAVDRGAELLDDGVVEPEHGRHRAGVLPRRLRRGLAALAHERDRVAGPDRVGGGERRVLADGVADDVVGLDPERLHRPQAGDRGRDERRLLQLRSGQLFERPLEAELRDVEADRLRRLVVHRARGRELLRHRTAHADVLRSLAREAEGDLHRSSPVSATGRPGQIDRAPGEPAADRAHEHARPLLEPPLRLASARQIGIEADDVLP